MEILFLGTGAATANPLPFCRCDMCRAARKSGGKDFRRRSSVLIDNEILIDLGPDTMTAADAFHADISEIGCLIQTHAHSDHFDAGHFVTRIADYATVDPKKLTLVAAGACVDGVGGARARGKRRDAFDRRMARAARREARIGRARVARSIPGL
jgi:phosphoribosyl 1,2-cyclic phosphate phosphodiesterase